MKSQILTYKGHAVEFLSSNQNVMVNATEMAKIFGKDVPDFLILKQTQEFIDECLKNHNSGFLWVETEEDLYTSKQKTGTYMHRILALKFAAWLDPAFELWVYATIDHLLFDHYRQLEEELKTSALRKNKIDTIKENLRKNDDFIELEKLELEEKQASYSRGKFNKAQIDLFRGYELNC